jgi:hypothetical protein
MRDFLEYVEKSKEDSTNSLDFYMEGFLSDISKLDGVDPEKTFIIGFLAGKGININNNRQQIMNLLSNEEILSPTEAISAIKDDNMTIKDLRTALSSSLTSLRTILKEDKKEEMV